MTYTALLMLAILRDDYKRLDRKAICMHITKLQQPDGRYVCNESHSFRCSFSSHERDVRFSYAAFAVSYMLGDWNIMDRDLAIAYMLRCQHYEGAFAQEPGLESHGGSTYCVVAALALANLLSCIPHRKRLERWVLARQLPHSGFQGRVEKEADACYSFWCGASAQVCVGTDIRSSDATSSLTSMQM